MYLKEIYIKAKHVCVADVTVKGFANFVGHGVWPSQVLQAPY